MLDINTIASFLSGSVATLIIKESINLFNKRQDFNREIKKITYTKKLDKAEKAVAFYWTYLNRVTEVKKSFEVLVTAIKELDEKGSDMQIIQDVINKNGQILSELATDKYLDVNSVHLYFDLEEKEKWNENDTGLLLKSIAETKSIDNDVSFWVNLHDTYNKQNDRQRADHCWTKAIELLPNYITHLQNIIDIFDKNKTASYSIIQSIKKQIKSV